MPINLFPHFFFELFERLNGQKASIFVSSFDGGDITKVEWEDHEENFESGAIFCVLGKYIDDLIVEFRTHSIFISCSSSKI